MRLLTVDQLGVLLKFALQSLRGVAGVEPFARPVDPDAFPDYKVSRIGSGRVGFLRRPPLCERLFLFLFFTFQDYVAYPMDLATVDRNVRKKQYGSTEAFLGDVLWILHNCVVYNSPVSKLTAVAKTLVKARSPFIASTFADLTGAFSLSEVPARDARDRELPRLLPERPHQEGGLVRGRLRE